MNPYVKVLIKSLAAGAAAIGASNGVHQLLSTPQTWFFFFWPGIVGALVFAAGACDPAPAPQIKP